MTIEISIYWLVGVPYFCMNSYLVGLMVGDDNGRSSFKVIAIAGAWIYLFGTLHWFLRNVVIGFGVLFTIFQIRFFFLYVFTRRFHNMEHTKLEEVTNSLPLYARQWGATSLRYILFKYSIDLVNKRNNYIHINKNENEETDNL